MIFVGEFVRKSPDHSASQHIVGAIPSESVVCYTISAAPRCTYMLLFIMNKYYNSNYLPACEVACCLDNADLV
jgi:hypothetical protein